MLRLNITHLPYIDSASVFELVAKESWAMFLDSGSNPQENAEADCCDVLVMNPQSTLVFDGERTSYTTNGNESFLLGDPLGILQSAIPECEKPSRPTYLPGAYGYMSYDLSRYYEKLPCAAEDQEKLPPMAMGIYHVVLVVDHRRKKSRVIRMGESPHAKEVEEKWLAVVLKYQEDLVAKEIMEVEGAALGTPGEKEEECEETLEGSPIDGSLSWPDYQKAFEKVRTYTEEGDCYQVNLTKQFSSRVTGDAWSAYKCLRKASPAPYSCFMNLPFVQVLSNSPESFIRCHGRDVVTSPIKGTRPRNHKNSRADKAIGDNLLHSPKDRAENLMIVDLMRNDLSKVCELGSVKVPKLFELHSFSNVHHLISQVTGKLREELHSIDLLRACFPGGSITGAPKIRSMEIIEELEPTRRGLYCGSIAYIGANGDLESNIAIRTIVIKDGVARFSAGGGLVIDSMVEDEYQELNHKVSMLMSAVVPSV